MRLFKQATHLLLPITASQTGRLFAQLTGRGVLRALRDSRTLTPATRQP